MAATALPARRRFRGAAFALVAVLASALPAIADDPSQLTREVVESRADFVKNDPGLEQEIAESAGYALFPAVGKGGFGIGGAYGIGQVIVDGLPVARTTLMQVNVGFQLGGQKYAELILFKNKETLDDFLDGAFTLNAQASAVAVASGAAANAKYSGGVSVITMPLGGLMYEAAIGGQKFAVQRY
jgi:lipid-binding SYLF domain-containing protein